MYRAYGRNTKQEALLVQAYNEGNALSRQHFLSDVELYYLQHLSTNEALLEYYHQVQEGLCSIFIQSKIVDGKFKIDGSTTKTNALTIAGEAIPEVGSVLTKIAAVLEYRNELAIKEKLQKISGLVRDDMKNLVAKYIASKLVIKRRTYLTQLTLEEIKCSVTDFEKLRLIFEDTNVHMLKA